MASNQKFEHILIVEDEMLVAMQLEDMLSELGHQVAETVTRVDRAIEISSGNKSIDLAILDINVAGKQSFPVADILRERHVPFMFTTGYAESMAKDYSDTIILQKPYSSQQLNRALEQVISGLG